MNEIVSDISPHNITDKLKPNTHRLMFVQMIKENEPFDICREWIETYLTPLDESTFDVDLLSITSNIELFEYLLKNGFDPNRDYGCPVIWKCSDNIPKIKLLLRYGANPNQAHDTSTIIGLIMHEQPSYTILMFLHILLEGGADPNRICAYGTRYMTPLDQFSYEYNFNLNKKESKYATDGIFLLMQYGATKHDIGYNDYDRINRILLVCDLMLYTDDDVPLQWKIEIKGCLY